jgi:hypothetical protein
MEQTLEQKIFGILNDDKNFTYSQLFEEDVFAPDKAVKELHKLFIQEIEKAFDAGIARATIIPVNIKDRPLSKEQYINSLK